MVKCCTKCGRPEGEVEFSTERSRGKLRQRSDCKGCRLPDEIAKCQIVCANCHRVRTQDRHSGRGGPAPQRERSIQMKKVA